MATNRVFNDIDGLSVVCTDPTTPASGGPVRVGGITGVALTDERADGTTSVDFAAAVYDLSVEGIDDAGNSAVAAGDSIFYGDGDDPKLSKKSSGFFFGYALEAVDSAGTATIRVLQVPAGPVGGSDIATIGKSDLPAGFLDVYSADGQDEGSDATYTVTGVAVGDEVAAVLFLSTKASVATVEVLAPAGFTVTAANTITAGTPVDRSNDQLIFFVIDKT